LEFIESDCRWLRLSPSGSKRVDSIVEVTMEFGPELITKFDNRGIMSLAIRCKYAEGIVGATAKGTERLGEGGYKPRTRR